MKGWSFESHRDALKTVSVASDLLSQFSLKEPGLGISRYEVLKIIRAGSMVDNGILYVREISWIYLSVFKGMERKKEQDEADFRIKIFPSWLSQWTCSVNVCGDLQKPFSWTNCDIFFFVFFLVRKKKQKTLCRTVRLFSFT